VRVTNVRKPATAPEPPPPSDDERYFPEEGSAEGCASGECLPDAAPPPPATASPANRDAPSSLASERWRSAVESVKAASVRHGAALSHGRLLWLRTGEIGLAFRPQDSFHRAQVNATTGRSIVEKALSEHFGRPMKLVFEDGAAESAPPSLAEEDAQSREAHEKSTEGKVRSHPAVRSVLKLLGGEIEHIQVYEPERPSAAPPSEAPEEAS
jgi:hypothetical protein